MEKIILAGGCFWCISAVFKNIKGIINVVCGYSNGNTKNPTYEEVCTNKTGFAEVVELTFDNSIISLSEILDIFFYIHNPTELNRQGDDIGEQYRSGIYFYDENQEKIAIDKIKELQPHYDNRIVTEIKEVANFYVAEEYHQDYFVNNKEKAYCQMVISPKYLKAKLKFAKLWNSN